MLDYYGSIQMTNENIDKDILQVFKNHQEKYIRSLLNNMRIQKILGPEFSVSGYHIFVRQFTIDKIKDYIEEQSKLNNKKLIFSYIFENYSKDNDLLIQIVNYLK